MPNEYLDLIPKDEARAEPEPLAETKPFFLEGVNPDEMSKAVSLGAKFRVPEVAVERAPEFFENEDLRRKASEYAATSLPIAELLKQPRDAQLASDSIEGLSTTEKLWRSMKENWERGRNTVELAEIGKRAWLSPTGRADEKTEARIAEIMKFQPKDYFPEVTPFGATPDPLSRVGNWFANFLRETPGAASEFAAQSLSTLASGYLGGAAGALGGAAAGGLAGLGGGGPGVAAGAGAGACWGYAFGASVASGYQMLQLEGVNWYLDNRDATMPDGTPVPVNVLRGISLGVAIPNMFLERFALGTVFGDLPGAKSMFGKGARFLTDRVVGNAALSSVFARLGAGATESSVTNGFQEGMQEFVQIVGTLVVNAYRNSGRSVSETAKKALGDMMTQQMSGDLDPDVIGPLLDELFTEKLNPFSETNVETLEYNGLKGWDAMLARIGDAMYTGAAGGLAMGGGSSAIGTTIDVVKAQQSVAISKTAEKIANVAVNLPVLKRNPEIFRGFMQDVIARHGGAEMLYLPTESARKLFQSAGAEPVLQQMPRLADDISKAEAAGTDVAIPFADYLTYVAPTGLHEQLQGELRFDPTSLTAKEAENLLAELPKQAKLLDELLTDETQSAEPTDSEARRTVFNAVYGQLAGAPIRGGELTDADAARYASFWLASMEAHAKKTKQSLAQVLEQGGVPQFKFDEERIDKMTLEDFNAALDQIRGEMTAPPAPAATENAEATTPAAMTEEEKATSLPSEELADPEAGSPPTSPTPQEESAATPPAVSAEPATLGSPQPAGSPSATPAPASSIADAGAARSPRARRRVRGLEAVRRAVQRQRIDLRTVSNDEARALITEAGKEPGGERRALEQVPLTPQAKRVIRYLTPEQASKRNATVNAIAETLGELDTSANELAAAALAGQAKRGWYRNSQRTIEFVFGPDAARFTALLAATSPQAPVQDNLKAALKMWLRWDEAGRPTDEQTVTQIVASVRNFPAWTNNAVLALTAQDPENVTLSGLKVESFRKNLRGDFNAVTADAWVAALFAMPGEDITALSPYAAISSRFRQAAQILTEATGETWTPAEVQETTWSWAKAHVEARKVGGPTVGELSAQGAISSANLRDVPDFDLLMTQNEAVRKILEGSELGRRAEGLGAIAVGAPDVTIGEAATAPLGDLGRRALGRLADRLEHVYQARRAVESLRAEDPSISDRDALRLLRAALASQRGREAAAARSSLAARQGNGADAAGELPAGTEGDGRQRSDVERVLAQPTLRADRIARLGLRENREGKVVFADPDGAEFTEADLLGSDTSAAAARALNRALGLQFSEGYRNTLAEMKVYRLEPMGSTPEAVDARLRPWLEKIGWSYRIFGPKTGAPGLTFAEKFGDQQPPKFRAYYPDFSDPTTLQYEQKVVQIYDPSEHEGSFSDTAYTLAWRVPHEVAHGLTNDEMTVKYGAKGNRAGALGAITKGQFFRTVEKRQLWEALRAVEWELVTFKKQREIFASELGIELTEEEFQKENSINLAGAVYRAVTGQFANPEEAGILPTALDPDEMLQRAFDLLALIAEDRGMPLDMTANPDVAPVVEAQESEGDAAEEAADSVLAGAPRRILEQSVFHGTDVKRALHQSKRGYGEDVALLRAAERVFPETSVIFDAGYITQEGVMLDFSEGGGQGRTLDHRSLSEVEGVYDPAEGEYGGQTKRMRDFINRSGSIRIHTSRNTINAEAGGLLTNAQARVLVREARDNELGLMLELVSEEGETIRWKAWDPEALPSANELREFTHDDFSERELEQETRGSIDLTDPQLRSVVVSITSKNADHTTVLHEMAHYWLARLERDAPQFAEIAKDLAGVKKWLGIKLDAAITDAHHEKFARAFELYLYEGKSPNVEMRGVFAQARAWVIKAYKSITNPYFTSDGKPIELSDDVRAVFDRLIATDEQIEQARRERGLNLKLGALISQGLSSAEAERYEQLLEEARQEQFAKAVGRSMRDLKKQLAEEKRNEKEIRAEAKKSVESRPIVQAREWLARGVWLGEGEAPLPKAKLSTATLTGMFGRAFVAKLPKQIHRKSGATIHPDFVAQQFGFKTAHEMLVQLADSKPVEDLISAEAQARIEQQREEQAPSALAEEVVAAMDSRKQIDVLVFEEKAIAKQNGGRVTPNMILRRAAQRVADTTRYREANAHLYRVAAERAGRAALEAVANGDFVEAQKQKSKQRFNLFIETALRNGKEEAEATIEFARKGEKRESREKLGKAGESYLQAWDDLLELVDLKPRSNRAVDRLANLRAWVESEREAGRQPLIHQTILEAAELKSYKNMTLAEIENLGIALRNIKHLADVKTKLLDGKHENDIADAEAQLTGQLDKKPPLKHPNSRDESREAKKRRITLGSFDALLRRAEFLIDEIDEGKLGPWRRLIWRPLKDAEAARNQKQKQYTERLMKLLDGVMRGRELEFKVRKEHAELGGLIADKSTLIAIALNLGNEGNLKRLLEGSVFISPDESQWTEAGVRAVLFRELTERDWKFVQDAWDLIDTLWPEIVAQEKRRTGIAPERVEAREVDTPYGVLRGGYYPVVYDHRLADFAKANMERDLFENTENGFRRPHTWAGFTESRKEVSGPLMLELFVLPSHIDKVIHHLTHWEAINNINELLRRKDVRASLKTRLGDAYSYENYWLPWLQAIANDRGVSDPTLSNLNTMLTAARNKVSVFTLGLRATTLAVQPLGQLNAMGQLRQKLPNWKTAYAKHARIVMQPHLWMKTRAEVAAKSAFMRDRVITIDRDTRDALRELSLKSGYGDRFAQFSMELIGKTQLYSVDLPVWLTAYNGALDQLGMGEQEAIDFADSIVSMSQSAGGQKDLAPIQRGDAVLKQFLMFYGFLSAQWNQLRRAGADVSGVKDVPRFLATFAYSLLGPTILSEIVRSMIKGRELPIDDDDDDEWSPWEIMWWVTSVALIDSLGGLTGLSPVQQIASSALGQRPREPKTPMDRIAETFDTAIRDTKKAAEGEEELSVALLDWLRVYGLTKGLPLDDPTQSVKNLLRED